MKIKLLSIAAAVALSIPNLSFGQAPNMGSAVNFVLFTSNGAMSNTGFSHLTGHVGSNNGSSTNFGNVDGVMHNNNGTTALCAADLLTAYNQLNATVPTFFPAPLLGNGQSLNAGVYAISGNSTLNNTLTLNAQNNANAVFIIQIAGAFATSAGSKVVLINGAKACNVFWKIEGAVNMATGTSMKGTVIANNAAITINTGVTLEGRALSTAGAVTINGILAYTPIGCGSPLLTGPASPTLNSTTCYGVFSGNGPVTNSGITFVTGDVGTNVGLTTGHNALNVTGAIHPIPDGSTGAAAADLLNVYNYLNTLPYDIELLYPAQFGNSLVLTPHVYRMNGAATFIDTLFLNGGGNANAVFVIQINGAIASGTYAKVKLTNGTQAKNVFWRINGAVNLNNFTEFEGTIVVNNGAISLNTGVVVNGRAFTTNGALSTTAITVVMPPGCSSAPAPTITTQPVNKTACLGSSMNFSVAVSGAGPTYQWRKGTVNLVNGGNISGATSAILVINPVSVSDVATNYNVIVTGYTAPNATSTSVSLATIASPTITTQPINVTACNLAVVNFSVAATGTGLTYQWRLGTVNLTNGGNISGATSAMLILNPLNVANAATNYNVLVMGSCAPNGTSSNVSLVVNTVPLIVTEPINQVACNANAVSFSVVANGTGLTYQWRKGIVNLTNGGNISGATSAVLTINPTGGLDLATDYNVVVNGACSPLKTSINAVLSECGTVGIPSFNEGANKAVTFYPNPFATSLNITINDASQINNSEVRIYNVIGVEVLNIVVTKKMTTIETGNLPSGAYFYNLTGNNKTIQSGRLVRQQ